MGCSFVLRSHSHVEQTESREKQGNNKLDRADPPPRPALALAPPCTAALLWPAASLARDTRYHCHWPWCALALVGHMAHGPPRSPHTSRCARQSPAASSQQPVPFLPLGNKAGMAAICNCNQRKRKELNSQSLMAVTATAGLGTWHGGLGVTAACAAGHHERLRSAIKPQSPETARETQFEGKSDQPITKAKIRVGIHVVRGAGTAGFAPLCSCSCSCSCSELSAVRLLLPSQEHCQEQLAGVWRHRWPTSSSTLEGRAVPFAVACWEQLTANTASHVSCGVL
jgi:hypothetical protein